MTIVIRHIYHIMNNKGHFILTQIGAKNIIHNLQLVNILVRSYRIKILHYLYHTMSISWGIDVVNMLLFRSGCGSRQRLKIPLSVMTVFSKCDTNQNFKDSTWLMLISLSWGQIYLHPFPKKTLTNISEDPARSKF